MEGAASGKVLIVLSVNAMQILHSKTVCLCPFELSFQLGIPHCQSDIMMGYCESFWR